MHPSLQRISHSGLQLLHACPRKFQLSKLSEQRDSGTVHTDFGSIVGEGIQTLYLTGDLKQAVWKMFVTFKGELFDDSGDQESKSKSFWHAIDCLQQFVTLRKTLLKNYDVAIFDNKPAVELGFRLHIPGGFTYRGYVDIVLVNRESGQLLVLEIKTTRFRDPHEALYQNSGQGLGYSIFTRKIDTSGQPEFRVLYLVYSTSDKVFKPMIFPKAHAHRALWIQNLVADCSILKVYDQFDIWPQHGESCMAWGRPCHWFGLCTMSTKSLIPEGKTAEEVAEETAYDFELSLDELVSDQLVSIGRTV